MFYYITRYTGTSKDAGTKAPKDINIICKEMGWKEIPFLQPKKKLNKIVDMINKIIINKKNWTQLDKIVSKGDYILYQHPMYFGTRFANKYIPILREKGVKFIALIHDLESLRNLTATTKNDEQSYQFGDLVLLNNFDYIIAHNNKMKEYLISKDIEGKKIISLEIFDYLCDTALRTPRLQNTVVVAGNLDKKKSGYIYELAKQNPETKIVVFGANYPDNQELSNINYEGSFSPEEITGKLEGAFGIVWDGPSIHGCVGKTGEYLKYNNPHKTSMYLTAGIPVIVWKEAAISEFIIKANVGITVDNLDNVSEKLKKITNEQYNLMVKNAENISSKLRTGYYFRKAVDKVIRLDEGLKKNES